MTTEEMPAAVRVLIAEHDVCRRHLEAATSALVESFSGRMRTIQTTLGPVRALLQYLDGELETHIAKEEGPLFARLKAALPLGDRLIDEMVAEHDLIRMRRDDIRAVLAEFQENHDGLRLDREVLRASLAPTQQLQASLPRIQHAVTIVAEKLRVHFENEEELVFPLVPDLLSGAELKAVAGEMQTVRAHPGQEGETNVEAQEPAYIREHGPLETPLRVFHFEDEVAGMKRESSWSHGDRTAKTLAKEGGLNVVLTIMKAGTELQPHRTPGALTIQCLSGHIRFSALERRIELGPGEMAALDGGIEHGVEASEESAFLLTIVTGS